MKWFLKKFVLAMSFGLLLVGNMSFSTSAHSRYKQNVDGYELTASNQEIFDNRESRRKEIASMEDNLFVDNDGKQKVIILDCGIYDNVFHTGTNGEYESHHLISSNFCKKHPDIIKRGEAPAVLIPKNVHYKTGSHTKSGRSEIYFDQEEACFDKSKSIKALLKFGLDDLKVSFDNSEIEYGSILDFNSPIIIKLGSYADLLDARAKVRKTGDAQDANKLQFISNFCIFTPFKPKMKKEIYKQENDNIENNESSVSGKRKRGTVEEVYITPTKRAKQSAS